MNESILMEKLLKIEALFAGAATEGERVSADLARERILKRLREIIPEDPPVEYKFTFRDMWSRKVFVTLLRRYGLSPYRYYRQRYTTVMAQIPKHFVDETLWPEFQEINEELSNYLQEITDRVVRRVLHEDSSDAAVVEEPLQIEMEKHQNGFSGQRDGSDERLSGGVSPGSLTHPQKETKKRRPRSPR